MTQEQIQKRKEYRKAYRQKNKEKIREYQKAWRLANPEKWQSYQDKWKEQNREQYLEMVGKAVNKWHQKDTGRASNLLASYVQFDRRYGYDPTDLTRDDILRLCYSNESKCVYCGCTDHEQLGLERISNKVGHHVWNVVTSCRDCNVKRARRGFDEYLTLRGITFDQWLQQNGGSYGDDEIKISLN